MYMYNNIISVKVYVTILKGFMGNGSLPLLDRNFLYFNAIERDRVF